jgi:hypothetical protein
MGEVIADGWVEETVEAVDFAAPHDFGERHVSSFCHKICCLSPEACCPLRRACACIFTANSTEQTIALTPSVLQSIVIRFRV